MNWLKTPNLPTDSVSTVMLDYRADEKIIGKLNNRGIKTIPTCKNKNISGAICGHADIMICHLGGNSFVCSPDSYDYFSQVFGTADINLIKGNNVLSRTYPRDTAYNVAMIGDKIMVCAENHTDTKLLNACKLSNLTLVNVKQAYAKCNTCVISSDAIITSDVSIAKGAIAVGIDTLLISPGHIRLPGHEYGFIGGATGLLAKDTLAICGTLRHHPDYSAILAFCHKYGVKLFDLSDEMPIDIGSILPLSC